MEQADPEKLVLGIPTYGRAYKLEDPWRTLGSFGNGPVNESPITGQNGSLAYFEVISLGMLWI